MFILLYAFAALGLRPHKHFVVTSVCSAGAILLFYIFTQSTVYTHFTVVAGAVMAVYLILSSVYICVTAVKHRLMGYI
ncbi:histidine kinase, partial [[Eubacterium] siraeum]|nr:histidine kinase [[Eubacterium] siraeum]